MFNLKYHIASLIAVFCSLAIGIFIGTNLVGNDVLLSQQKDMIAGLEQEFNSLREQNKAAQDELAVFKDSTDQFRVYCEEVFPLLVKNRLQGVSVGIIETDAQGLTGKTADSLVAAGASVPYQVTLNWDKAPDWEELIPADSDEQLSDEDMHQEAARKIAGLLLYGQNGEFGLSLEKCGFMNVKGSTGVPVGAVIVLDGSEQDRSGDVKSFDVPLVEECCSAGKSVIVGEYAGTSYSCLSLFRMEPVTTIDDIDTAIGQTSAVFALGGQPGHYGVGETADRLMPKLD